MTPVTETKPAQASTGSVVRVLRADARRNREAVIAAAKKLFADQGLDAQMPDVAKAAKVGVGTVYRHFPTKDDLIAALAARALRAPRREGARGPRGRDPWEGLCDFIRFSAQIQADDRGLCEVMGSRPEVMDASALGGRPRRALRPARQAGSALGRAAQGPRVGGHPDDRLRPRAESRRRDGPRHRPLAAARRDHPRRPARARQLEAAEAACYLLARFLSGAKERQVRVLAICFGAEPGPARGGHRVA